MVAATDSMDTMPFDATQAAAVLQAVASPVGSVMVVASPQKSLSPDVADKEPVCRSLARDFSSANLSEREGWGMKKNVQFTIMFHTLLDL